MTDGHDDIATEGKEAVRLHFVQRLADAGVTRCKGMTEARYGDFMKGLIDWLSYMDADNLQTLAELVIENAAGARCPSEVFIQQTARNLQKKPPTENRIFSSWLASKEGPPAQAGGYLVELFRFLRQRNMPPSDYDMKKIHELAADNQRTMHLIRGRIDRQTDTPEDRQWMAAWTRDQQTANDIVAAGAVRRAAKASGEATA